MRRMRKKRTRRWKRMRKKEIISLVLLVQQNAEIERGQYLISKTKLSMYHR